MEKGTKGLIFAAVSSLLVTSAQFTMQLRDIYLKGSVSPNIEAGDVPGTSPVSPARLKDALERIEIKLDRLDDKVRRLEKETKKRTLTLSRQSAQSAAIPPDVLGLRKSPSSHLATNAFDRMKDAAFFPFPRSGLSHALTGLGMPLHAMTPPSSETRLETPPAEESGPAKAAALGSLGTGFLLLLGRFLFRVLSRRLTPNVPTPPKRRKREDQSER